MRRLVIATGNVGKLKEIEKLLDDRAFELLTPRDFPDFPDVIEDGTTFEENAIKKAVNASRSSGLPALADDSGLVVDALHGKPGVFSARFAGEGANDSDNNAKLLQALEGVPLEKRTAHFRCVVAFCNPDGGCYTFKGKLDGFILESPSGNGGFGYDPLFFVKEYGKTLAELSLEIKNKISHRGKALELMIEYLRSNGYL